VGLLSLQNLSVHLDDVPIVSGVNLDIDRGERVGLIGESGSGKSLTALAVMGLLPQTLAISGHVLFDGEDLLRAPERRLCALRGSRLAMVFQEPMTALNPTMRVGKQIAEVLRIHRGEDRRTAMEHAVDLLARVEFPAPSKQARQFPHQLSGGQRQRAVLAMAIACDPDLVLADEPTTALDVTVQAQMLELLGRLVDEENAALLLISHDMALVSTMCERIIVMYGGRIVEGGPAGDLMNSPKHPYTEGLLATALAVSLSSDRSQRELPSIPGNVPGVGAFPSGCPFRSRCPRSTETCCDMPALTAVARHEVACWHPIGAPRPSQGAAGLSSVESARP
jgi:peptide/nickel transport system ATP-binding protein